MSNDLKNFIAASEAAERWVSAFSESHYLFVEDDNWIIAIGRIMDAMGDFWTHYGELSGYKVELAGVSDGVIRHHGLTYKHAFSSAHEAIAEISHVVYLSIFLSVKGIKTDDADEWMAEAQSILTQRIDALVFDYDVITARLLRERAKLAEKFASPKVEADEVDWLEYHDQRDRRKPLLTVKYCKEEYGLLDHDFQRDEEAKKHRRNNPDKKNQHVYRYVDVHRLNTIKSSKTE